MTAKISNIAFYPIKSTAGIEIPSATLTPAGLVFGNYKDHEFMVVSNDRKFIDANRKGSYKSGLHYFITQRDKRSERDVEQGLSRMALIKTQMDDGLLRLTWNYSDPIEVPYDRNSGGEIPVIIWEDEAQAVDQGDKLAEWFSDHLNLPLRLVKAAGPFRRMARQNYMENNNPINFHDAYPAHWFSAASVRQVCSIAQENIPWQSFRPQIVVSGVPPQYEHNVFYGGIAGIPFFNPKPCDRCSITLVEPGTGEVRGKEPLRSLAKYKKWKDRSGKIKVIFGENMVPQGTGEINIGDEIVTYLFRDPPLVYGANV
ncbi:MAG: MOSC N-terminal beta barrel domain-containing protein [Candidatus Aenigmarchaeota archaeon]|nr:MOSC N-terminal beta barrel domain-containing protein [Candidatus Aenigmarchaeota archaeon]